jgi:hypothetical protein
MSACSDSTLSIDDYDTSCAVDDDCVAVFIGDVCPCGGGCANAAINKRDQEQYREDYQDAYDSCSEQMECMMAPCEPWRAYCPAGQCEITYESIGGQGGTGGSGNSGGAGGSGGASGGAGGGD